MEWTAAAIESFGLGSGPTRLRPVTAKALRAHCAASQFEVPEDLQQSLSRITCQLPDMTGWTGYAPRVIGDRWVLAE